MARNGLARLKLLARSTAGTLIVCTAIALILALLVPAVGGLRIAWVNSICIGMTANLLIHGGWHWFWGGREPSAVGLILLCVASVLLAIWLGAHAAAVVLGQPADWLGDNAGGVRVAALLATVGGTASVAGVIWIRQYTAALRLRTQLAQARADAAARLADEAQLRMLRAQLEPHMLFNTLATLRALIQLDPDRAQAMLDHLVAFMRGTLSASRTDRIALATEFEQLDNYLNLMAIRMAERLSYKLTLPAGLASCPVLPMLLQPLVENAVRHGLEPLARGGHIEVGAHRRDTWLELYVTDTGDGFADTAPTRGLATGPEPATDSGFGLGSVRARLRAAYGEQAGIEICSPYPLEGPGGARVTLRLPLADPVLPLTP